MKTTNDLERPDVVTFLASVPADDELARLTETYTAAMTHVTNLQARTDAARQEIARIDERLVTSPEEQSKLLGKRAEWMQALDVYPAQLTEAIRRRGLAHLYWLARLRAIALQEAERAADALAEPLATARGLRRRVDRDDVNGTGFRNITPAERDAMEQQRVALKELVRDDQAQLQRAQEVAAVAQGRAQMMYGELIDLEKPGGWSYAIEQRTRQLYPPGVGSWVHA
jgi:hypothetical protein